MKVLKDAGAHSRPRRTPAATCNSGAAAGDAAGLGSGRRERHARRLRTAAVESRPPALVERRRAARPAAWRAQSA